MPLLPILPRAVRDSTIIGKQLRSPHSPSRASSHLKSPQTIHASTLGSLPEQSLHTAILGATTIRAGDEGDATHAAPSRHTESPPIAKLTGADTTPFRTPNLT